MCSHLLHKHGLNLWVLSRFQIWDLHEIATHFEYTITMLQHICMYMHICTGGLGIQRCIQNIFVYSYILVTPSTFILQMNVHFVHKTKKKNIGTRHAQLLYNYSYILQFKCIIWLCLTLIVHTFPTPKLHLHPLLQC